MTRIVEGELDLGFVRLPLENVPPGIAVKTVMVEKMLVALNKDHVLARKRRVASADLRDEQLVLYSRPDVKPALHKHVQTIPEKGGFPPKVPQKTEKMTTVIELVASASW